MSIIILPTDGWGTRNLTMDPDTFAYLYNKVDGQTWYIQDILNRLYQNGKEITTAEIDDVTLELVNEQEVAFVNYYDSLTPLPRIRLSPPFFRRISSAATTCLLPAA